MGRGWVHGVRTIAAAKKGKVFTKIAREITVAVKLAGANPESNARLRSALRDGQKNSMPRDTVERAIKRGEGRDADSNFDEIMYEGYAAHGVACLIETLTDNKNRTVQDLRAILVRRNGNLGEAGSVKWMFNHVASVVAIAPKPGMDAEEAAINAGADAVEDVGEGMFNFTGSDHALDAIQKALHDAGWEIQKAELAYKAKNPVPVSDDQQKEIEEFVEALDDLDDVKRVHLAL